MLTPHAPHASHRSLLVRTACGLSLAVALLVGVTGCPSKDGSANQVSGKVTLGTEAVAGTVIFVGPDGKEKPTPIMANGNYKLDDPPIGKCKVLVKSMGGPTGGQIVKDTPPIKDAPKLSGGGGAAPPAKYGDAKTTDVEVEVKAGKQTIDIPLKP